jgi:thiamine biosynthesis lipoprotein
MKRAGAPRGLVNLGSEVGSFTDGPEWTVSIPHPADPQRPALRLPIGNAALSTASQSQRWFVFAGVRYGHIIDPRNGRPVATSAAVTTIAPSGFEADALSSALLVMGRADAQAFAQRNRQIGVVWLEPSEHELLAWRWNVPKVEPVPGVALRWMDGAGEAPVSPRQ